MSKLEFLSEFLDLLSEYYGDVDSARRIAVMSELRVGEIDFEGSSNVFWYNILERARKEKKLQPLRNFIEYESEALDRYFEMYARAFGNKTFNNGIKLVKGENTYIPFSDILEKISVEHMPEIKRVDCNRSNAYRTYLKTFDEQCTVTILLGKPEQNSFSLAERMMLERIDLNQYETDASKSIWVHRNPANNRLDELVFKIKPNFKVTKRFFLEYINSKFEIFNEEKKLNFSTIENYKTVSIALNYDYKSGSSFIYEFVSWLYDFFATIKNVQFRIYLVLNGIELSDYDQVYHFLSKRFQRNNEQSVVLLHLKSMATLADIQSWWSECNVNYSNIEFFKKDLNCLKISEGVIDEFINNKSMTMKDFELYQSALYGEVHK